MATIANDCDALLQAASTRYSDPTILNRVTVILYQRVATNSAPALPSSNLVFTFSTGALTGTLGNWSLTPPSLANGGFLFITTAKAVSATDTDTLVPTDWAAANLFASNDWSILANMPTSALTRVALGSMHSGGMGNVRFTLNQDSTGAASNGKIRVQGTKFYHPDGTTRLITDLKEVFTPFKDTLTGDPSFLIFTDTDPYTRFATAGFNTANHSSNFFVAVYSLSGGTWSAVDSANNRTVFTPTSTDCIVGMARKYTATAGSGIDTLSSFLSVNTNLPADGATVGATWGGNISGQPSDPQILNSAVSIGADGTLSGAGGGQVTLGGIGFTGDPNASSDIVLKVRGTATVNGNIVSKPNGALAWDSDCYSSESFVGGAYAVIRLDNATGYGIFGLNSDPLTDSSWTSIDYGLLITDTGGLYVRENGASTTGNIGTAATGDVLGVFYDGSTIKYVQNGNVLYSHSVTSGARLFFDSSLYKVGTKWTNVRFGPLSSNDWGSIGGSNKPADNATVNTVLSGLLSARPTGGNGDLYYATDTKILYQKVSGSWVSGATAGAPSGTPVGSTDAATVEANANNAIPNASQAVSTDNIVNDGVTGIDVFSSVSNAGSQFVVAVDSRVLILASIANDSGSGTQGYRIDKFVSGTTWTLNVAHCYDVNTNSSNLFSLSAGTYRICQMSGSSTSFVTNVTILKIKK